MKRFTGYSASSGLVVVGKKRDYYPHVQPPGPKTYFIAPLDTFNIEVPDQEAAAIKAELDAVPLITYKMS